MKKFTKVLAVMLVCVFALFAFAACAPNNDPDKALASLKEAGYTAAKDTQVVPGILAIAGVKGIDVVISGTKVEKLEDGSSKTQHVTVIYFLSADAANTAWDDVKEYAEDKKEDESDFTVAKFGKMIYFGTSAGIKAAA